MTGIYIILGVITIILILLVITVIRGMYNYAIMDNDISLNRNDINRLSDKYKTVEEFIKKQQEEELIEKVKLLDKNIDNLIQYGNRCNVKSFIRFKALIIEIAKIKEVINESIAYGNVPDKTKPKDKDKNKDK